MLNKKEKLLVKEYAQKLIGQRSLTEIDYNDPILVLSRARKEIDRNVKPTSTAKSISAKQREQLEKSIWDINLKLKDLYVERRQILSDQDLDAGMQGSSWTDNAAQPYGADLELVDEKIQKLLILRKEKEAKLVH